MKSKEQVYQTKVDQYDSNVEERLNRLRRLTDLLNGSASTVEAAITMVPDLVCIWKAGTFRFVNHAFTDQLGWSERELLSDGWIQFIHPDDVTTAVAAAEKATEEHVPMKCTVRMRVKGGGYKTVEWTSTAPSAFGYAVAVGVLDG